MSKLGVYELNSIIHGDCLEVMPGIPNKSIGMILADLPYSETQNEWDELIPLEPLWIQFKRLIRPGGAIVLTATQPFASLLVMSNPNWFKWEDIWEKSHATGHLNCKVMPMRQHENILVFGQGRITYNPQLESKPAEDVRPSRRSSRATSNYGEYDNISETTIPLDMSYPRSVVRFNSPNHGEKGLHPTQKPLTLFTYLVKTFSNPGDVILDSCCGSATTAIAAIETGRNWLCIEKESKYVEVGRERVRERLLQPFIPGLVEVAPQPVQLGLEGNG